VLHRGKRLPSTCVYALLTRVRDSRTGFGSPSAQFRTWEPFPNAIDRVWGPTPSGCLASYRPGNSSYNPLCSNPTNPAERRSTLPGNSLPEGITTPPVTGPSDPVASALFLAGATGQDNIVSRSAVKVFLRADSFLPGMQTNPSVTEPSCWAGEMVPSRCPLSDG
jgi:hypothetical protein